MYSLCSLNSFSISMSPVLLFANADSFFAPHFPLSIIERLDRVVFFFSFISLKNFVTELGGFLFGCFCELSPSLPVFEVYNRFASCAEFSEAPFVTTSLNHRQRNVCLHPGEHFRFAV